MGGGEDVRGKKGGKKERGRGKVLEVEGRRAGGWKVRGVVGGEVSHSERRKTR